MKKIIISILCIVFWASLAMAGPQITGSGAGGGVDDSDLTAIAALNKGTNEILCVNGAGAWALCTTMVLDDSAAQFFLEGNTLRKLLVDLVSLGTDNTTTILRPVTSGAGDTTLTTNALTGGVTYKFGLLELAGTWTTLQTFTHNVGLQVGATGVLITSDNDGAITFTGASAGSDEDLTINLDDTADTAVFSSSTGVTSLNFSALNMVTTGTISGKIPMITKTEAYTLGTDNAQEAYGYIVWLTGDGTVLTLPAVVAGMSVCVYSADSTDKVVDPNANDGIRNGTTTRNADGHKITSGAADQGSYVCLVADSADGWTVLGKAGTWTDE